MASRAQVSFSATQASVNLDALRALAAFVVLFGHWRAMFFWDYWQLHATKWFWYLPDIVGFAGHQAVIVFFVLSGYLIGKAVLRKVNSNSWSWREYLLHRVTRLWIVLIPALLLCALWDTIGIHSHAAPGLYNGSLLAVNYETLNVIRRHTVGGFFSNLFFLQGTATPTYGSDGPLWSLANEFWYYLLFPCALMAIRYEESLRSRILHTVGFAAMVLLISPGILVLFPCWLVGVAAAYFRWPEIPGRLRPWIIAGYVVVFLYLAKAQYLPEPLSDYVLADATLLLMMTLLSYRSKARESIWSRLSRRSAGFSYTLYLVHFPFLTLVAAFVIHDQRWKPTLAHTAMGVAILGMTVAYAYGVASVTEFHTERVREWIRNRFAIFFAPAREGVKVAE